MDFLAEERLYFRFYRCFIRLKYKGQADLPIGPGQMRILAELSKGEGLNQTAIKEKFGISASTVSSMLAKLEKHEFITRERDGEDKRNLIPQITDKGRKIVDTHYYIQKETANDFFNTLNEDEQSTLINLLDKLITASGNV